MFDLRLWNFHSPTHNCQIAAISPNMMAEEALGGGGGGDGIFVYTGGNQRVPDDVRHARIHESVNIIGAGAFENRRRLISVEFHDGIEIVEERAFYGCPLTGDIILMGVKIVKKGAFEKCLAIRSIKMPSARTIIWSAFSECTELRDVEFGDALETLEGFTFFWCKKLKRIALPIKSEDMVRDSVFVNCPELTTVHLVGGVHNTIASFHMESWKNDMNNEINRINQVLPVTCREKTAVVQEWMGTVISKLDHHKAEHLKLMKEATTLLELALWNAQLHDNNGCNFGGEGRQIKRRGRKRARTESRVKSGADIVIKNVLPFLQLK